MDFLLSVLIPTLPDRSASYWKLRESIAGNGGSFEDAFSIEILVDDRKARKYGGPTIAAKRNALYEKAKGKFSVQIDDDDLVLENYLHEILKAIRENADVHAIEHDIMVCGRAGNSLANVSVNNKEWKHGSKGRYKYYQPIYYKVPILTEICRKCKMDESQVWREDAEFSRLLKKHVSKTYRINKALYIYNDPGNINVNERY